jgi:uncharacterized spore protein YtfJ
MPGFVVLLTSGRAMLDDATHSRGGPDMADTPRFDPSALTNAVADTLTVRRVYGEPYERGGVTVIPVARVWGAHGTGAGGGEGQGEGDMPASWMTGRKGPGGRRSKIAAAAEGAADELATDEGSATGPATDAGEHGAHSHGYGQGHGGGGAFTVQIKAVGVYVIDDAGVHWRPSIDVNRVVLGAQLVGATAITAVALAFAVKGSSAALAKGLAGLGAGVAAAFAGSRR